jgi:hypothetical protein
MKAKLLSFVFMSFSESGLFNGLRPIQIKNFPFVSARVPGCGRQPGPMVIGARSSSPSIIALVSVQGKKK